MNQGKICVSVCADTADEFFEKIKRAEEFADVIELRFDCLKETELNAVKEKFPDFGVKKPLLATFRPAEQGGKRSLTLEERLKFWEFVFSKELPKDFYVDFEFDLNWIHNLKSTKLISSFHDFSRNVPFQNYSFSDFLPITKADVWKIAVQANEITDSIAIWKLLEKARSENVQVIPIAMGEAGKWTRILGLANGAFMTYAALDAGNETAPGQISARDLVETYRVKELSEKTEIYGIIGDPVSQSVSPFMHNAAFKYHDLDAVYVPFEVKDLQAFLRRMVKLKTREIDLNFKGFSVTIPHKRAIIPHLDFIGETARKIGAVNTVKISDGKLFGYNTDAEGFINPLRNSYGKLEKAKAAVLGAGGAARAAIYALEKDGAEVTVFARSPEKAGDLADKFDVELKELPTSADQRAKIDFNDFDILVNSTPLGMKGEFENETPAIARQIENVRLIYDLVYNPFETLLIKEARRANVPTIGGLAMLVGQGLEQFHIWTDLDAPMKEMSAAAFGKLY